MLYLESQWPIITQTPGRIHKVDPPQGCVVYTIGVLESTIGGSTFGILPASGYGRVSLDYGLPKGIVAYHFGLLGFPGMPYTPES